MHADDLTETLQLALDVSGLEEAKMVVHRPRQLSDNGSSNMAGELAGSLEEKKMKHLRSAPNHP